MSSGLAAEYSDFGSNGLVPGLSVDYYLLRPETVETLFYLYRITADDKYRTYAWNIFQSIEAHCKVSLSGGRYAYAPVRNVNNRRVKHFQTGFDHYLVMHSFFLSETLKYLYLIFSDSSLMSIDEYVFNTEAHPFRLRNSK